MQTVKLDETEIGAARWSLGEIVERVRVLQHGDPCPQE